MLHTLLSRVTRGNGFYIGDIFHAAARRDATTQITLDRPPQYAPDRGTHFTVGQLADQIDELAARLWAVGVRPTERVALYKSDDFDIALLACAAARIGAVPALLSPALDGAVAHELLVRLEKPWLLTDGDTLAGKLRGVPLADDVRQVLLSAGTAPPDLVAETADRAVEPIALAAYADAPVPEPVFLHPRQPSLITHSSGTTGIPKLAVHCPEAGWHRLVPQRVVSWPIRGKETAALCMTFVHSRFYQGLAMFLSHGNPMVIAVDPHPDKIGPLFVRTRPGYIETHPNTYIDWEELDHAPGAPLSSVRVFGATFDAMHPRTIQRMLAASRHRRPVFVQFYGQSEIGPMAGRWYTRRTAHKADGRCVGLPLPGFVSLRVVDDSGRRLGPGRSGHLEVRSRTRILTYLGEDERFRSELRDGWWRVGDTGYLDRRGLLHLMDREVDRIDAVDSSLAVEDLLMGRLEELREVVIVADPRGEPVPVVATRGEAPLDESRWRRATVDLPPMSAFRQLRFDDLPRTSTRKIQRSELARRLWEEHPPPGGMRAVPDTTKGA
ncbi:acyl-coenzyme A synthetase/AMP-(fatty) acid ligase [Streptomyces sp. B3I7]|uniref:class I adenylate-forming enzyme family protein n=1 Tax=Streptomyces sp. B3I7 TaxID=3042269 RepID=UPI00277F640B|nr:AMP-binding protein [Streptomyces sp. B3I7]MDQ0810658.1 acyl-coenzyme A synthetase/AMP-(fatty) acid ligase [Streptomyces sp. B3I7]